MRISDIPRLAENLARDTRQVLAGAAAGNPVLLPATGRQARLAICQANTCGFYSASYGRCLHPDCGCYCAAKSWFHSLHCPAGLWQNQTTP